MSYVDPGASLKVIELVAVNNQAPGTVNPSYSSPTFTQAFDARPYMTAMIILVADVAGAGMNLDVTIQTSPEPDFTTWTDATKSGGGTAAFTTVTPSNDNDFFYATIDLSKAQNAVGVKTVVSGGLNRVRNGIYAILFPYDTTNASVPQFEI
tara:strand:- start:32999 stop:33454 length:456 start_codon:yes stop_codon:yes gene_type:complete